MADDPKILVRAVGSAGGWTSPETAAYMNEAHLQSILVADPSRVPGVSPAARAVEELPTSGGPIDVCIVDDDGSITVVECKLASNSERRRMVIGQVIDYASAICADGERVFLAAWRARGGADLADELSPASMDRLAQNIADAHVHLCLAVDAIDSDLRRLVEYLNRVTHQDIRVTALQLAYARHGDLEFLIPSTYGGEIAAAKTRTARSAAESWTWESFLEAITSDTERAFAVRCRTELENLERLGSSDLIWYGSRNGGGLYLHLYGLRYAPFQFWVHATGRLLIYGNWTTWDKVKHHPGFASLATLLGQDHLGRSRGVSVDAVEDFDRFWAEACSCARTINEATPSA